MALQAVLTVAARRAGRADRAPQAAAAEPVAGWAAVVGPLETEEGTSMSRAHPVSCTLPDFLCTRSGCTCHRRF